MYAYAFSTGTYEDFLYLNSLVIWVQELWFLKVLLLLEVFLFLINVVSAISYTRIYGHHLMEELCEGDEDMRKKLLSIFPNLLTLMNAVMGISAVMLARSDHFHLSFVLLVFATVFDKLDGAAARKLGLIEEHVPGEKKVITIGMILDDIADLISFCIAPALIAAIYVSDSAWTWTFSLYALLGLARLIYFTLDSRSIPGFFKGLPSPAAALFVGGVVHFFHHIDASGKVYGDWVVVIFLLTGMLMNAYVLRYVHFGRLLSKSRFLSRFVSIVILISIFSVDWLGAISMILMGAYILSPLYIRNKDQTPAPA